MATADYRSLLTQLGDDPGGGGGEKHDGNHQRERERGGGRRLKKRTRLAESKRAKNASSKHCANASLPCFLPLPGRPYFLPQSRTLAKVKTDSEPVYIWANKCTMLAAALWFQAGQIASKNSNNNNNNTGPVQRAKLNKTTLNVVA